MTQDTKAEADELGKMIEELRGLARRLSNALLKIRPLGGSELFIRAGEDFYADPDYCGRLIDKMRDDLHEARKEAARLQRLPSPTASRVSAPDGVEGWQWVPREADEKMQRAMIDACPMRMEVYGLGLARTGKKSSLDTGECAAIYKAALATSPAPVRSPSPDVGPCEVCGWRHGGIRDEGCLRNDGSGECPRMTAKPSPNVRVEALREVIRMTIEFIKYYHRSNANWQDDAPTRNFIYNVLEPSLSTNAKDEANGND